MPDSFSRKTSSADCIAPGTLYDADILLHPNDAVSLCSTSTFVVDGLASHGQI